MAQAISDPTLSAAVRMEIRENPCKCCTRGRQLMRNVHLCNVNSEYPRCRQLEKGFEYDEGDS